MTKSEQRKRNGRENTSTDIIAGATALSPEIGIAADGTVPDREIDTVGGTAQDHHTDIAERIGLDRATDTAEGIDQIRWSGIVHGHHHTKNAARALHESGNTAMTDAHAPTQGNGSAQCLRHGSSGMSGHAGHTLKTDVARLPRNEVRRTTKLRSARPLPFEISSLRCKLMLNLWRNSAMSVCVYAKPRMLLRKRSGRGRWVVVTIGW
jgi:hypothetical protein